ncbi:MASE1 domain-containing protein [Nostoc sp. FACHB-152]|uniref:MASE1 domain-containing protein n=1 Tax=unclassified Nostoc TaxID=2593658 RepID=UPI001688C898|nr:MULTISPECIES: MASE1 domain-containing protein [unclassified Nostoc]MBD2446235.1 MASE1 domain-containing protein [Nostoc sp. FACHB-152]MBD2469505.1 MASE1 domain-containing protein [Nostoc sp. FACHB-145]
MQLNSLKRQFLAKLDRPFIIAALIIPIVHLGLGYMGLSMTFVNGASAFWPSFGVFLAGMLLVGYRIWPIIFLSDFTVSYILFFKNNLLISSIIPAVNLITPFIATFLIQKFIKRRHFLERSQDIFKFIVLTLPSPLISSILAALTLCISGIAPWEAFGNICRTWLTSDSTGILIVTPLVLVWLQKSPSPRSFHRQQILELAFVLLSIMAIVRVAFSGGYPIEYMVIPPLIWMAFRFEARISTLAVLIVSAIAVFGTVKGFGSFAKQLSPNESLILLQSFICVIAITTFVIFAVTSENQRSAMRLRQTNDELERRVEERTAQLNEAKNIAEVANQAKSEFLASMSHELRTPLNGILGYTQILQRTETLTEKGYKGIEIIHQCGFHLLTLINDVLDLSKIEARKMELHPIDFHFPSFIEGVVEICRIKADQKVITFNYQPDAQIPVGIHADEKRLRQVLINLLGNAIKFTDKGGVTLKVNVISQETQQLTNDQEQITNYKIRFQVEDTGVGMTSAQLQKIFLPFEQVGEIKKQSEGTGLGLAISQKIVNLMGSSLQVESQLGQGSLFWFEVELREAKQWAASSRVMQQGAITGYQGEKRTILVVDDKWENRSVILNLLEPIGFELLEASNGKEGIDQAVASQPDLIITDIVMPVMDGFELIQHIKQSVQLKNIAIIASSASVFDSDQNQSLDVGADAFLSKPVVAETLLELLRVKLNLVWIYAPKSEVVLKRNQNTIQSDSQDIFLPAIEILSCLYELAKHGDVDGILQEANNLKTHHPVYVDFSQQVIQLAENFQIKKLREILEQWINQVK